MNWEGKEHIEQYFNQKKNELNKVLGRVYIIERKDQIEREICIILKVSNPKNDMQRCNEPNA